MVMFLKYLLLVCLGLNTVNGDYIAAVVEFNPSNYSSPAATLENNVEAYIYQIRTASEVHGSNIIVFPEYGLTGLVYDPANYSFTLPRIGASEFEEYLLTRLSNAARTYGIYVVVNVLEKENRTLTNGQNETIFYNAAIVFGNNGTLHAKYRKINLYQEPNVTPGNETVTFTTEFGTFALLICADIIYYRPSQSLFVGNPNITDVIFLSAWTSELPFFTALEVQAGYALANKINLLSANINQPSRGLGGSSIYHRSGDVLGRILVGTPTTQAVVAAIPSSINLRGDFSVMGFEIIENRTTDRMENFNISHSFEHNKYTFKSLNLSNENITEQICHGPFCCSFNIVAQRSEINASEVYKLVAHNGRIKVDQKMVNEQFCHLIACASDDISTCGTRQTLSTKFRKILVWGNYDNTPGGFYRPTTLRGDLLPLSNITYLENRVNSTLGISLNTTKLEENVLAFGIYGTAGGSSISSNISLILASVIFIFSKIH